MVHPITYADLDQLLVQHGFSPRVHKGKYLAYADQAGHPVFVFPRLPATEQAASYHVAAVRRWFLDTGIMADEEFDRWLCAMRFGTPCRESTVAMTAVKVRSAD